ncbi:MAG: hypothetical protein ABSE51_10245 [Terracidiphilus sp.]|jgi:hypothetical protein
MAARLAIRHEIGQHGFSSMRKSNEVRIPLLTALAKLVTGRRDAPESRYCVDEQGKIVPDIRCQSSTFDISYHYVYGGSSAGEIGDIVVGGSTTPRSESGISHEGFGYRSGGYGGGG